MSKQMPARTVINFETVLPREATLREFYTGQALAGLCTGLTWQNNDKRHNEMVAERAVSIADAALKKLEEKSE